MEVCDPFLNAYHAKRKKIAFFYLKISVILIICTSILKSRVYYGTILPNYPYLMFNILLWCIYIKGAIENIVIIFFIKI